VDRKVSLMITSNYKALLVDNDVFDTESMHLIDNVCHIISKIADDKT
ncbi:hypothetical protein THOM_1757, partial [Trachipleistophora hominis]